MHSRSYYLILQAFAWLSREKKTSKQQIPVKWIVLSQQLANYDSPKHFCSLWKFSDPAPNITSRHGNTTKYKFLALFRFSLPLGSIILLHRIKCYIPHLRLLVPESEQPQTTTDRTKEKIRKKKKSIKSICVQPKSETSLLDAAALTEMKWSLHSGCLRRGWLSQIQLGEKIIHIACILMSCYRPIIFFRLSTEMKLYFSEHG